MERFFNTAGPVNADKHYCLPPLSRFDLQEILSLIHQEKYFILHAPRQVGKTTCLRALMEHLNQSGRYRCLYINVESAQAARENVAEAMHSILNEFALRAERDLGEPTFLTAVPEILQRSGAYAAFRTLLTNWAEQSSLPTILLIDEIDSLVGDTLISVLRQLRSGYDTRPAAFPQSVMLCGVRDIRDYRLHTDAGKTVITGGSAFNIKAKSLRLENFTQVDVAALYRQHREETGQIFEPGVVEFVWELTQGQPWLVNALGETVCFEMKLGRDRSLPIHRDMIVEAKERLILDRVTHLDQLADKLGETRVRKVIEPILSGQSQPEQLVLDDVQYVEDLGLITTQGQLRIANPIYQEVIPRSLTYTTQLTISHEPVWYLDKQTGLLDIEKLLTAFQQFFREHSEHWVERFDYKEAGPQLLLQAFLQRIINGGGRIEREYGLGRKRTDLLLIWPSGEQLQRVVLELKILRGALDTTICQGVEQSWQYMDRCGASEGHLLIFNRDPDVAWDEKIFRRHEQYQGQTIVVWGM